MAKTGSKPTDELIRLAIIGDATAFTALWDGHVDMLEAYLRSVMKIKDDFYVGDICSKSFEKAFRQISSFNPSKSQFGTWLKTIAHNTAIDTLEEERRVRAHSLDLSCEPIVDDSEDSRDVLDAIIQDEDRNATIVAIEALPDLYRDVARLRFVEEESYKDIADKLGMELNTVRTRIRRARDLMEKNKQNDDIQ